MSRMVGLERGTKHSNQRRVGLAGTLSQKLIDPRFLIDLPRGSRGKISTGSDYEGLPYYQLARKNVVRKLSSVESHCGRKAVLKAQCERRGEAEATWT